MGSTYMSDLNKIGNLKKMSLVELRDVSYRETQLLKNSKLINKLTDKGDSIKKILERVEKEIKYREEYEHIEKSVSNLIIGEKHIQKLCDIEKSPEKERYKPFSTLNNAKEVKPDSKIFKIIEDCIPTPKPTKLINLAESIEILKQQDEKVKGEQMRARYERVLEKLGNNEESDESNSESEYGQHCSVSEDDGEN